MAQVDEPPGPPAAPSESLADNLGFLLGHAHDRHRALAAGRLAGLGLAPKEYGALSVLVAEGPLTQQQLGRRTGIDRTTMVAVADGLEHKGLAVRERSPADRRAYALGATAAGRRTLRRAARAIAAAEEEFLAALPERQRGQLKSILRRLALS
jgi:DNA-binding MarR family transcriptional regulator